MDRDTGNTGHMTQSEEKPKKKTKTTKMIRNTDFLKKQLLTNPNQFPLLKTHTKVQYYS
jgi:hypothetical protein